MMSPLNVSSSPTATTRSNTPSNNNKKNMMSSPSVSSPNNIDDIEEQALLPPSLDKKDSNIHDMKNSSSNGQQQQQQKSQGLIHALRFLLLFMTNVISWYMTNGFNGIALQSYSKKIRSDESYVDTLLVSMGIMTAITALQLAVGAIIGSLLLKCVLSKMIITSSFANQPKSPTSSTSSSLFSQIYSWFQLDQMSRDEVIAGTLHGIGSVCTNLGFQYGSASVVQILKLLEPFETLALSQLLTPDEGRFTFGVVSSMSLVVGAAVSLIRIRPTSPHINSIIFAILSGMTLSLRNVLQRKAHASKKTTTTTLVKPPVAEQPQHNGDNNDKASNNNTSKMDNNKTHAARNTNVSPPLLKLQQSVRQFTQLSLHSSLLVSAMAIVINGILILTSKPQWTALSAVDWRVLTWHPLYNIFSMITLGFCSALTHSLLNAGKRVFAILMAILWFGEDISSATVVGLAAVACGGLWYTVESKQRRQGGWQKIVVALVILKAVYEYQSFVKRTGK